MSGEALAAVEHAIERGGDADDVLRAVVEALVDDSACEWSGIFFAENGRAPAWARGGYAEAPGENTSVRRLPGRFASPSSPPTAAQTPELLDEVAVAIAPYCLVGWDTGGVPWDEAG